MIFLETRRLILRNVAPRDAAAIYDYRNSEVCARYQRGQTRTRSGIDALVQRRRNDLLSLDAPALLAIALKETDELVGEVVVMPQDGTISLGYTVSYLHHRKGYAFEALSALLAMLHERFPSQDFVCFTDPENRPSMALLQKLGYQDLGYAPKIHARMFGKWLRPDTRAELRQAAQERRSIHPTAPARLEGGRPLRFIRRPLCKTRGRKAAGIFCAQIGTDILTKSNGCVTIQM